jgi:hypothetical protein
MTTRLTKLDAAISQLCHAIGLYLESTELISSITLAGAAEEILGKLVKNNGGTPAHIQKAEGARSLYIHLWKSDPSTKRFIDLNNNTRNELKHLCSGEEIEVDLKTEAKRIIDRAVKNFHMLGLRSVSIIEKYERSKYHA